MKVAIQWTVIVVLVAIYASTLWAVLHPHVSAEYRAFYIDRTTSEYKPSHYSATPEQGMDFSRRDLPDWVASTYNLYFWDGGGRWTDNSVGNRVGLRLARPLSGDFCMDFTAYAVPWLEGKTIQIELGNQERSISPRGGSSEYRVSFIGLQGADKLEFVLPQDLPRLVERDSHSNDPRRLGISLGVLKFFSGECKKAEVANGR